MAQRPRPIDKLWRTAAITATSEILDTISEFGFTWLYTGSFRTAATFVSITVIPRVTISYAYNRACTFVPLGRDSSGEQQNAAKDSWWRSLALTFIPRATGLIANSGLADHLTGSVGIGVSDGATLLVVKEAINLANNRLWAHIPHGMELSTDDFRTAVRKEFLRYVPRPVKNRFFQPAGAV